MVEQGTNVVTVRTSVVVRTSVRVTGVVTGPVVVVYSVMRDKVYLVDDDAGRPVPGGGGGGGGGAYVVGGFADEPVGIVIDGAYEQAWTQLVTVRVDVVYVY